VAEVKPFRALRYDEAKAGPLDTLVAPPYDVIGPDERAELLARSPYNVVHLTLPDTEERAARDLNEWRARRILVEEEPSYWALEQDYTGPDGIARTRRGIVVALRIEPYDKRIVLPHERTHAGPKEGRLRLLRATRTQLEPIFLLYDGPTVDLPDREPDLASGGDRLWRAESAPEVDELLIADGHHRYETALAFHEEDGTDASARMMVVLVSTREEGLTIFATHRIAERIGDVDGPTLLVPGGTGPVTATPGHLVAELDAETTSALAGLARSRGLTLNTVVQGAWALVLSGLTGRDDVVFGMTVAGRTTAKLLMNAFPMPPFQACV